MALGIKHLCLFNAKNTMRYSLILLTFWLGLTSASPVPETPLAPFIDDLMALDMSQVVEDEYIVMLKPTIKGL
jgi:hypothetical protein